MMGQGRGGINQSNNNNEWGAYTTRYFTFVCWLFIRNYNTISFGQWFSDLRQTSRAVEVSSSESSSRIWCEVLLVISPPNIGFITSSSKTSHFFMSQLFLRTCDAFAAEGDLGGVLGGSLSYPDGNLTKDSPSPPSSSTTPDAFLTKIILLASRNWMRGFVAAPSAITEKITSAMTAAMTVEASLSAFMGSGAKA
mmetsp:Transcript_8374/g.17036  ORF Transcript_8374/g.17036 Transcript_8374/m.17036 type:complete len:195 (-) Transcript_8374:1377-1961(-)